MSSHHFVKEGQEPALIILDAIEYEVTEPLLEWSPVVVAFDSGVDQIIQWGTKLDVVVAAENRIEILKQTLVSQAPVKILSSDDSQALETALYFLISVKQQAVNIISGNDHSLLPRLENFLSRIQITLITKKARWSGIVSGHYKKWFPADTRLLLHGYDRDPAHNLEPDNQGWKVADDGFVELEAKKIFWVGEIS